MTAFEAPAGRVRALYGKTRGIVARRKALQAKAAPIFLNIHDTDSESEVEKEDDKENNVPAVGVLVETKFEKGEGHPSDGHRTARQVDDKHDEDRVEMHILPKKPKALTDVVQRDDEDCNELASSIESNLRIASSSGSSSVSKSKQTDGDALMKLCRQKHAGNFSAFLNEVQSCEKRTHWKKIGEASFSEVFGLAGSGKVVKIIPLADDTKNHGAIAGPVPDRSAPNDVHREVQLTQALSKVSRTFVKMYSSRILKGKYPARLLNARDQKVPPPDEASASPENFSIEQEYAALILADGGQDLESIEDLTWTQAASIFCQVVDALSSGENAHQFEHRDLHWGNIVITLPRHTTTDIEDITIEGLCDPRHTGVKATIIDYTLSRATIGETLIAYDFTDESLFQGEGDMQFDIYRQMKTETKGDWQGFHPITNVLWLNYLASKLIDEKHIPNPKRRSRLDQRSNQELQCRNLIMGAKQVLLVKRFESASDFNDHLASISLNR